MSRSLPRQVHRFLNGLVHAHVPVHDGALKKLRDPAEHTQVTTVLSGMCEVLRRFHPRFRMRRDYQRGSVNPEAIAYWLVELAQQTREKFCGYPSDVPPAEHYGSCRAHRNQLAALSEIFIAGVTSADVQKSTIAAYWEQVVVSRREWQRNQRQFYWLVKQLPIRNESQLVEVWREITEKVRGETYVVIPARSREAH